MRDLKFRKQMHEAIATDSFVSLQKKLMRKNFLFMCQSFYLSLKGDAKRERIGDTKDFPN